MLKIIDKVDSDISTFLYKFSNIRTFYFISKIGGIFSFLVFFLILSPWFYYNPIIFINISEALFIVTLIVFILKYSVRRKRFERLDNGFFQRIDPFSFPSGHVSRLASLFFPLFDCNFILGLIVLAIVFIVFVSRIIRGNHFFSDCLVGFFIGILSGYLATSFINIQGLGL